MLFAAHARIGYGMGIDFSEHAIAQAIQERDRRGMAKLDFVRPDISGLASDASLKGRFDSVLVMDVTEHIYDKTLLEFLASARHVLRETGKLYIHTPNGRYYLELTKRHTFCCVSFPATSRCAPPDAYAELLERGGCKVKSIVYLPHYHGLLGKLDQIMMRVPLIRRFFQSRLLIVAVRS